MNQNGIVKITAALLILSSMLLIAVRISHHRGNLNLQPGHKYVVSYNFQVGKSDAFKVNTFLPTSNQRQQIRLLNSDFQHNAQISLAGENKMLTWRGMTDSTAMLQVEMEHRGKPINFSIDPNLIYEPQPQNEYVAASQYIQSTDPRIIELAENLLGEQVFLTGILDSIYQFVYQIPSSEISDLTDALTVLDNMEASCNGKSRLFVALCRSLEIPSRVTGGLILEETTKKTSHLWVEVLIQDQWVPFDALNGHFASLPSHYLELYKGDEFLITRTKGIDFDYNYQIRKERINDYPELATLNLWNLMDETQIPMNMFKMLLLLPLGAFLVAIFKNIIGLKTYGVFLPVLVSLVLLETGFIAGVILFSTMVIVVSLVSFPLEKLGIQYNSKITAMLISVVITALMAVKLLHETQWLGASVPLFFPIIILTIVSEKFAKKIEEEGVVPAMGLFLTTMVVTIIIYWVLSSELVQNLVLTFPEIILAVAGLNLQLGKWIGLRMTEYYRFRKLANS